MYQTMCKKLSKAVLVALIVLLPACSTQIKYVRELPPVELLADCPYVAEKIKTNGELAWTILEYRKALELCNLDKQSLREWVKE
jgi:hypothetical protein